MAAETASEEKCSRYSAECRQEVSVVRKDKTSGKRPRKRDTHVWYILVWFSRVYEPGTHRYCMKNTHHHHQHASQKITSTDEIFCCVYFVKQKTRECPLTFPLLSVFVKIDQNNKCTVS